MALYQVPEFLVEGQDSGIKLEFSALFVEFVGYLKHGWPIASVFLGSKV